MFARRLATLRQGTRLSVRYASSGVIEARAAVAWKAKEPLSIERVLVAPPKPGEVRETLFTN